MASADLSEELSCSICLSIYMDPVMLTCGHSFCRECITSFFNRERPSAIFTCPECREQFKHRPSLQKNLKLCNIVDHYQPTRPKRRRTEVFCTYCVISPVLAVKTCLRCEASLCDIHLRPHSKAANHILTEPTASLKERNCSVHGELMKYFCFQDSSFLCVTCSQEGKHKGHRVELLDIALETKEVKLYDMMKKISLQKEETVKQLKRLQVKRKSVQEKAARLKAGIADLFKDIKEELAAIENKVLKELRTQENNISLTLSDLIQKLEMEVRELDMKVLQTKELSSITDPLTLLKESVHVTAPRKAHTRNVDTVSDRELDEPMIAVILQEALNKLMDKIPELKAKRGFHVQDASDMILNVDTADIFIALSQDMRTASDTAEQMLRPPHPERFTTRQVLTTRKFTAGKHYWKVTTSKTGKWAVGVTYNSVKRTGDTAYIGQTSKSWCIFWEEDEDQLLTADHNKKVKELAAYVSAPDLGVYLDYEGGVLSFYELSESEPVKHLHTFTATFTEPLHGDFHVEAGAWVRIGS